MEDTEQYIHDGSDHPSEENIYDKIDKEPTQSLTEAINILCCETMYQEGVIDPPKREYLI